MRIMLAALVAVGAALLTTSCSDPGGKGKVTGVVTPTATIGAQIAPQAISLDGFSTLNCPIGIFSTRFDLLISASASSRAFVDSVTVRLADGSNLGGPSVTFARPDLDRLFGSTLIVGTATFPLQPQFECLLSRPSGLVADIIIIDANGNPQQVTATATVKGTVK